MRLRPRIWALILTTALGFSAAATIHAQERHIVDRPALQAAVTQKAAVEAADRAAILNAMHQPQAQTLAASLGLTPTRVDDAVATLSASEVTALANPARAATVAEAGGDTIVISVTTLLLLLILLVLLVK
jgi:hypothetical protein